MVEVYYAKDEQNTEVIKYNAEQRQIQLGKSYPPTIVHTKVT
jgi:hypothetical protein